MKDGCEVLGAVQTSSRDLAQKVSNPWIGKATAFCFTREGAAFLHNIRSHNFPGGRPNPDASESFLLPAQYQLGLPPYIVTPSSEPFPQFKAFKLDFNLSGQDTAGHVTPAARSSHRGAGRGPRPGRPSRNHPPQTNTVDVKSELSGASYTP